MMVVLWACCSWPLLRTLTVLPTVFEKPMLWNWNLNTAHSQSAALVQGWAQTL